MGTPSAKLDRRIEVRPAPSSFVVRLQLTPEEGFLLSRLDRAMPVSTLVALSGLPDARAESVILQLLAKKAILGPGDVTPAVSRPPPGPTKPPSPYDDYVFSPVDLADAQQLPLELRKEIVFLHAHLPKWSHWRVLGVKPDASADEVRKAFLTASKKFHPDNFFRQDLGRIRPKLEAIFQRLKLAADVLADDAKREKYLTEARDLFSPDEVKYVVDLEVRRLQSERRREEQRGRILQARGFKRLTQARDVVANGDKLLAQGDIKGAMDLYRQAQELDPRLESVKARIAEAQRIAKAQRSDLGVSEAKKALDEGQADRAKVLLRSAVEADPSNERAHAALAQLLLQQDADWNEIRVHAQKAVEHGDTRPDAQVLLARCLCELGRKKEARRILEPLAATHEAARALLKRC